MMHANRSGECRQAYTLIELLLALAVMSVIATIVVPSFFRSYFEHRTMDQSVSQVMETMLTARQLAVQTATPFVYEFTPGTNQQRIFPLMPTQAKVGNQVVMLPSDIRLEQLSSGPVNSNRTIFREDGTTEGIDVLVVSATQSQAVQVHRRLGIPQRVIEN